MATATATATRVGHAQAIIDTITAVDRHERFGDDRQAWYDNFDKLWYLLTDGAKVRCVTLGTHTIRTFNSYGMAELHHEPSRLITSGASLEGDKLTYCIMTTSHTDKSGQPPYVMVCYGRDGMECARIKL